MSALTWWAISFLVDLCHAALSQACTRSPEPPNAALGRCGVHNSPCFIVAVSPSSEGWYWEVALKDHGIIARGIAESPIAARTAGVIAAIKRQMPAPMH
jgi:hypothetical protein